MRVFSVSTSTHLITKLVSLEFCEGYMKDTILFFEKFFEKLGKDFKPSVQELKATKSSFFLYHYSSSIWRKKSCHACSLASVKLPIFADADGYTHGHGFFERLLHKSPFGAITLLSVPYLGILTVVLPVLWISECERNFRNSKRISHFLINFLTNPRNTHYLGRKNPRQKHRW